MVKIPKKIKRYCPFCDKHTEQKVRLVKGGGKRGGLKKGTRVMNSKLKGYGSFPREKPEASNRYGVKRTKKADIRYECTECGKMKTRKKGIRASNIELVK